MNHNTSSWLFRAKIISALALAASGILGHSISAVIILLLCLPLFLSMFQMLMFNKWLSDSEFYRTITLNTLDALLAILTNIFATASFAAIAVLAVLTLKEADMYFSTPLAAVAANVYMLIAILWLIVSINAYRKSTSGRNK